MPIPDVRSAGQRSGAPATRVTVIGGTGFLGRRVVARLIRAGAAVTIAARRLDEGVGRYPASAAVKAVEADIADRRSLEHTVVDASAVVNCVGLYRQRTGLSFEDVHVRGGRRLAEVAASAGARRLLHVSGIGADPDSPDDYIRARGRGEVAVREAMARATIVRPSAMFSASGAFFDPLRQIVRRMPVVPLFGSGGTRLQPVNVEDVAEAIARLATGAKQAPVYEFGGPVVYTFREIIERLAAKEGRSPVLLPVPFAVWSGIAAVGRLLPAAPITPAQVALMRRDNIVGEGVGTFDDLGIVPRSAEALGLL